MGNGILNRQSIIITVNTPNVGSGNNNDYIDIDNEATTFSSSSADLEIPSDCKRIVYSELY